MVRFNALLQQIKSPNCRIVISIINISKSKVLQVAVTDVKNLYIFRLPCSLDQYSYCHCYHIALIFVIL
jgi:hypothetical protein